MINIYGNEKTLNFFKSAFENGKMAHAYILEGGRGSGKHTLARYLACLVACRGFGEHPCFSCETCRKIEEGISPDVIEYSLPSDRKTIGVETVRDIRQSVFVKPSEEDVKVYIIGNAEMMTFQAQNVFLKVLEEPPAGVYFFLLTENTANILPTVKSRAPVIKMQSFGESELEKYLIDTQPKAVALKNNKQDEFELVLRLSEGRIGEALRLINDFKGTKGLSKHEEAEELILQSGSKGVKSELLLHIMKIATSRDELSDVLNFAMYAVRDIMAIKKTQENVSTLLFYKNTEQASEMSSYFTAKGIMNVFYVLDDIKNELEANVNLSNTAVNLFSGLCKASEE